MALTMLKLQYCLSFAFERLKPVIDEHSCQTKLFGYGWQVVTVEPSTVCQLRLLQLYLTSGIVGIESFKLILNTYLRNKFSYFIRCINMHFGLYIYSVFRYAHLTK